MLAESLRLSQPVARPQVLPPGASKGSGVSKLLQELNVEPQHLMTLGDGENDVEMLQVGPACT